MWNLVFFTIFVCFVGSYIQRHEYAGAVKTRYIEKNEKLCMFVICISFILFCGLRTSYNDTANYISFFRFARKDFIWTLDEVIHTSYWGFEIFQTAIKKWFDNVQWMIMASSIITNIAFLKFYRKYSKTFALTLLCFIIIQPFMLTCAALKQVIAMSISLWGVDRLLKGDKISFYLSFIPAYTFHPYIIVMAIAPFLLDDKIWSKKMIYIVIVSLGASMLLSQLMGFLIDMTEGMNKTYSIEQLLDHTINPLRVVVDGLPVVLSIILRKQINAKGDKIMFFGINMMIISFMFTFASLFGNPIYIYRMGNYFGFMNAIVIPWMLKECLPNDKAKSMIIILFYAAYIYIFLYDMCGMNMNIDPFRHTSISTLFEGWFK